jgi:aldehyde dehydrogenase (NAD+)
MLLADMIHEAGFPPGVFNLVNGDGLGVGRQLSSHPDVDVVSFTGSTRAGKDITKTAADTVKRVCLELGGKGANLIFHDADKDAVTRGVTHCFENTGQSCNSPSRMLVEKSRYEQACQEAKACAEQISVNTAHKNGPHIGPAVSKVQYDKIQNLIQKGIDEGATLLVGGTGRQEGLNRGYFVRPTIFANVTPQMTIAKEEIFGPVLAIIPFNSEEEAFSIANDTAYGLTNYIQTSSRERAERFARASRTGMVAINGLSRAPGIPFGGFKQSGNGREGGSWGLLEFLEIKSVSGWGYNCS